MDLQWLEPEQRSIAPGQICTMRGRFPLEGLADAPRCSSIAVVSDDASRAPRERADVTQAPNPSRSAAGVEVGMSDGESTGLIGVAFWCVAFAAFLLWALKHLAERF
jgi:hypothetical protein